MPACPSRTATSCPMPPEAPATRATRSVILFISSQLYTICPYNHLIDEASIYSVHRNQEDLDARSRRFRAPQARSRASAGGGCSPRRPRGRRRPIVRRGHGRVHYRQGGATIRLEQDDD